MCRPGQPSTRPQGSMHSNQCGHIRLWYKILDRLFSHQQLCLMFHHHSPQGAALLPCTRQYLDLKANECIQIDHTNLYLDMHACWKLCLQVLLNTRFYICFSESSAVISRYITPLCCGMYRGTIG